ncbi:hypothetical protein [Actinoplanes sp. NPDC089786]|uniref:hypothetical protein n=1 Tax=Actinoplanes sp. NPDC089786 TaxID=3155185 RepID=UPI0034137080
MTYRHPPAVAASRRDRLGPRRPPSPYAGGEFPRSWAADAVDAAYENTSAAIVRRLELFEKEPRTNR